MLVDGGFAKHEDIDAVSAPAVGCTVYSPVPQPKDPKNDRYALLIVLIAFWLAHGDCRRQRQATQEAFEIGSVLTGGIDADVEVCLGMLLVQQLQPFAEILVALLVLQDGERLCGRLPIRAQERNPMAVARGVDANADAGE
jgi:hypothetical protein